MSCHVMSCHVTSCEVMWCDEIWCELMQWDGMGWGVMWLHYQKNISILQSTTTYYKVLLRTTKCYSSSTLRGATCRTQNVMSLGHSCLIVVTHQTSGTTWPNTAPSTKRHTATHQILPLPRKVTFQQHINFTKYCASPEKWHLFYALLWYSFALLFFYSAILSPLYIILLFYSFPSLFYSFTLLVFYSSLFWYY